MVQMLSKSAANRYLRDEPQNFMIKKHAFVCYLESHQYQRGRAVVLAQMAKWIGKHNYMCGGFVMRMKYPLKIMKPVVTKNLQGGVHLQCQADVVVFKASKEVPYKCVITEIDDRFAMALAYDIVRCRFDLSKEENLKYAENLYVNQTVEAVSLKFSQHQGIWMLDCVIRKI